MLIELDEEEGEVERLAAVSRQHMTVTIRAVQHLSGRAVTGVYVMTSACAPTATA